MLAYYRQFGDTAGCSMNKHRDNYNNKNLAEMLDTPGLLDDRVSVASDHGGHPSGGDANSQQMGSDVVILTEGTMPMTCQLWFPPAGDPTAPRKKYIAHEPTFSMQCGPGTLFVFKAVDDVRYLHGFSVTSGRGEEHACGVRIAWVYRWLTSVRPFRVDDAAMSLDEQGVERAERLAIQKRKMAKRKRECHPLG